MKAWSRAGVLLCAIASSAAAQSELAALNGPAPMFRLPAYNPVPAAPPMVGLDRYVGPDASDKGAKLVLLSFMASFCVPCVKEMPYLKSLQERYGAAGLRVMLVSIDTEPAGQKIVEGLVAKHQLPFPVLKDRFNLVARRWLGAQSPLPSVFLVRPDGTIGAVHRGYSDEVATLIEREIERTLKPSSTAEARRKL